MTMLDRASLTGLMRAPRTLGALRGLAITVASIGGAALTARAYVDDFATDREVAAQVAPLATREAMDRAVGALRMEADQRARYARKESVVLFEMLISGAAADMERDPRRKFDASAFARTAYRDALARGMEPSDAAQYARDQRPPWRR